MKAMAKEPLSRYQTAGELADDLRRFVEDRPVRARRPTPIGLLARWARRKKAIVGAAAVSFACASLAGAGLLFVENARTRQALQELQTTRESERQALRLAFAGSDIVASRALEKIVSNSSSIDAADAEFCRRALSHYETICLRYAGDRELRRLTAAAEHRVGFLRRLLKLDGAQDRLARSVELFEQESRANPGDRDVLTSLSAALDDLAAARESLGERRASGDLSNRALEVRRELVTRYPDEPSYRLSVAMTIAHRIGQMLEQGNRQKAIELCKEFVAMDDNAMGLGAGEAQRRNTIAWQLAAAKGLEPEAYDKALELAQGCRAGAQPTAVLEHPWRRCLPIGERSRSRGRFRTFDRTLGRRRSLRLASVGPCSRSARRNVPGKRILQTRALLDRQGSSNRARARPLLEGSGRSLGTLTTHSKYLSIRDSSYDLVCAGSSVHALLYGPAALVGRSKRGLRTGMKAKASCSKPLIIT